MSERTRTSILQTIDAEVALIIAQRRGVSAMEGLRMFLNSETHEMLSEDALKIWYFSPLAIYDLWEHEIVTGDPRNSLYLRGDEIE